MKAFEGNLEKMQKCFVAQVFGFVAQFFKFA
jgi:hypothetical protein